MLVATGGPNLHDVVKEAEIVMTQRDRFNPVQFQPYIMAGANGNPPEQPEIQAVSGVDAIMLTTWDVGIRLICAVLTKYWNLFKEQSKRCQSGENYTWEVATLDALLYQCLGTLWRSKILAGTMNFQQALDYGIGNLTAKKQGKELANLSSKTERSGDRVVDRFEEEKKPEKAFKWNR